MSNITKVKINGEGRVEIRYMKPAGDTEDEVLLTSSDVPLEDFGDALKGLVPDVVRMIGIPAAACAAYEDGIKVTGATWSFSENQGQGVMILAQKSLPNVNSPFIVNTPLHFYGDGEDENVVCNLPAGAEERLEALRAAAARFLAGERQQGKLDLGETPDAGVTKALKKMKKNAEASGMGISIISGGKETVLTESPEVAKIIKYFKVCASPDCLLTVKHVSKHVDVSEEYAHDLVRHMLMRGQIDPKLVGGLVQAPNTQPLSPADMVVFMRKRDGVQEQYDAEDLYTQAVNIVVTEGKASTSYLQRMMNLGYNRAADIIDRMEKEGVISAPNHVGKREVIQQKAKAA